MMKIVVCITLILLVLAQQQQIILDEVIKCGDTLLSKCPKESDCYKEINRKCFINAIYLQSSPCKASGDWYDDLINKLSVYEDKQFNGIPTPNQLTALFGQYEKTSETSTKVDEYISEYTQLYNDYQSNTQDQHKMFNLEDKYYNLRNIRKMVQNDQKISYKTYSDYISCRLICYNSLISSSSSSQVAYNDVIDCHQQKLTRQQVDNITKQSESEIDTYSKQIKEKYQLEYGDSNSSSSSFLLIRISLYLIFSLVMIFL